jgi:Sec-independent protein translocase protein TatA
MFKQLRELIRGLQEGMREFRRASREIQDEIDQAIELRPLDETDQRCGRNLVLILALVAYTLLCLALLPAA